ncbi:MAG: response regulator [Acidobacteria bacterium]|nr:response regulator [Acidobacteriota bacterium]
MQLNRDAPRALEGVRVLVVDDNPSMRSVVRRFLQRAGCTVIDAGAPSEAVNVARAYAGHLDIALVDLVLPEMSGPECAEMLQDDRPELAVAYMSGYAEISADRRSDASAPILLQKPFARDELVNAIRRLLGAVVPGELSYTH